jgi:hypothetical protein
MQWFGGIRRRAYVHGPQVGARRAARSSRFYGEPVRASTDAHEHVPALQTLGRTSAILTMLAAKLLAIQLFNGPELSKSRVLQDTIRL